MKTKLLSFACTCALFSSILLFSGCEKKDDPKPVNYNTLAQDATISEQVYTDIFRVLDNESKNGQHSNTVGKNSFSYVSSIDTCAIVTLNTNNMTFPMTLTVDFGSGCTDAYGVQRKGKLTAVYSGRYIDSASTITISADNYYVNGYKVDGNTLITNDGRNNDGNLEFSVKVTNGVVTKPNGEITTWESERTNEWTEGEDTPGLFGICDDVYEVRGYGEGLTSDQQQYRIDITEPLVKKICCRWVSEGAISLKLQGNEIATIDYGTGSCDLNANLTYGGNTYVIIIQ